MMNAVCHWWLDCTAAQPPCSFHQWSADGAYKLDAALTRTAHSSTIELTSDKEYSAQRLEAQ
jgi:hypothetical protein